MTRKRNLRRRANAIKDQGGLCYFCGEPLMPPESKIGTKPHPKAATLDHLNPRLSDGRSNWREQVRIITPIGHKARNVAACWTCNNVRNKEFQNQLPIDVLHRQSGHAP